MKCDDVHELLIDERHECTDAAARRAAMEHLEGCSSCRDAQYAAGVLRMERSRPIPGPRHGALERAVVAAARAHAPAPAAPHHAAFMRRTVSRRRRHRAGFWAGVGVGGVVAAALAMAWVAFVPPPSAPRALAAAMPEVTVGVNETRDVNIAVDVPSALDDAEIRVVLTGAIGLAGFSDQRELRWRTDLAAGSNRLTLPVVATGARGGQLLVEVQHGQRRRTFIVDVRGAEA